MSYHESSEEKLNKYQLSNLRTRLKIVRELSEITESSVEKHQLKDEKEFLKDELKEHFRRK